MDDRIAGHAPASSESTEKYGRLAPETVAAANSRHSGSLAGECIPDTQTDVVEVGTARIAVIPQIDAAHHVAGNPHGGRQQLAGESYSRTRFYEIGPILAFGIEGHIAVPVELGPQRRRTAGVSQPRLVIDQEVVIETA